MTLRPWISNHIKKASGYKSLIHASNSTGVYITTIDIQVITSHYCDVIMSPTASQITSLMIVYSIVYSGTDQRKHQSSTSLAFVRGIHRRPLNSPHKWPVTRKMFPFDDVIMLKEQWGVIIFTVIISYSFLPSILYMIKRNILPCVQAIFCIFYILYPWHLYICTVMKYMFVGIVMKIKPRTNQCLSLDFTKQQNTFVWRETLAVEL